MADDATAGSATAQVSNDDNEKETQVGILQVEVHRRNITQLSQLPSRDQVIADPFNNKDAVAAQIVEVCKQIQYKTALKGKLSPEDIFAREKARQYLELQGEAARVWTEDTLVDHFIARLTDYVEILGEQR